MGAMKTLWSHLKNARRRRKILYGFVAFVTVFVVFIYFYVFHDLPSIDRLEAGLQLPSTRIYDRHGALLYEILPEGANSGRSTFIPLEEIPQHCVNAIIATEDANFYAHPGVDFVGVARALWINLRGGEVLAGGSTITQQLVRILLFDPAQRVERSLQRKLREMVLAIQLQGRYSKDEILELYLNQVYFGNLAYGIEAAAQAYFGKSARDLSLAECALLAGLPQQPASYDPLTNREAARDRQQVVLGLMAQNGMITQAQADSAFNDALQFAASPFPIAAPHAVMAVWTQLERRFPEQLYREGLTVYTSIDLNWTRLAQNISSEQLYRLNHPADGSRVAANANNAALVALNPHTGEVYVLLGSPDYFDESIDGAVNAALALRQPGSALKPFTYAAALDPQLHQPWTAATMVLDVSTPFITRQLAGYTPANFGFAEHGPVLVREALSSSYNIPAVLALQYVGLPAFIDLAGNAGLETLVTNPRVDLAVTLGGGEVRLLDLTQAYSIFPNGGYRVEPVLITRVEAASGVVLYSWEPPRPTQRIIDARVAYIITDILSDNNARIPGFGEHSVMNIGRPAAAKTGTTTNFRDNWIVGYTPDLVVGVWVGNANNVPMRDMTGISGAGPIWHQFMRQVLVGTPERDFDEPPGIVRAEVCALSGLLPTPYCPHTQVELFIPGTVPTTYDNLYQPFLIDSRSGEPATASTPPEFAVEQVLIVLPQEARSWGERNGFPAPPVGAAVQAPDADSGLRLLHPDPFTIYELSPVLPQETQRIRFEVGAPPGTQSVTYILNGQALGTVSAEPWALWWTLALGSYTLEAQAVLLDGSIQTTLPLSFTVADYVPPEQRPALGASADN